ncbi:MAG: helix-turn-helix transcriptional regulator [Ruminococcus sp.]|nr:helix-turn-helix transcriptional regulator [Ruminococcus sp.]
MAENRRIIVARAELALTQKDLAKAVGVSRQTIVSIEKGGGNPSLELCKKICKTLNKSLGYLFGEE